MSDLNPDWVISPGHQAIEHMKTHGWDFDTFYIRFHSYSGVSREQAQDFLDGKLHVTKELSCALAMTFGTTANYWLTLEQRYREGLAQGKSHTK